MQISSQHANTLTTLSNLILYVKMADVEEDSFLMPRIGVQQLMPLVGHATRDHSISKWLWHRRASCCVRGGFM